jgi:DNA primase large subunit
MLNTKSDLAKYSFTMEAAKYVRSLGLTLNDLASPAYIQILNRAEKRVEEAILYGIVSGTWHNDDIEILSFPASMILVKATGDSFLKRRYALAEAKRAYNLLKFEDKEKLIAIAMGTFNWRMRLLNVTIVPQIYDFALHFTDFLRNACVFHEDKWKLVNRVMIGGEIYLSREEAARLLQEEIQRHIQSKLESEGEVDLPFPIQQRAERLGHLLAKHKEEIRIEELPRGTTSVAFPPCIKHLYDVSLVGQHIPHIGRFALTSFLLNVGMSVDDVVKLFSSLSDFDEKMTRYQVEHIAGKRGSRTKYTSPNCDTLRTHGLCLGPDEICRGVRHPLTYYRRKLKTIKLGVGKIREQR